MQLHGQSLRAKSYAQAVKAGVVYLSEDRKGSGVFLELSIAQNIAVLDLKSLTGPLGLLNTKAEADRARDLTRRLGVRMGGIGMPVSSLSGGNQQKVAIAKQLAVNPKVIPDGRADARHRCRRQIGKFTGCCAISRAPASASSSSRRNCRNCWVSATAFW